MTDFGSRKINIFSNLQILTFTFFLQQTKVAAVDCGPPTYQVSTDQACSAITVVTTPTTTVQGSTLVFGCSSLLTRTKAVLDYCPVQTCQANGTWSQAKISCGATSECYNGSSQSYMGRRICTSGGRQCQRWDSQLPHPHSYNNSETFPDKILADAAAYCRDPGGLNGEPWCYTVDPAVERENCAIPTCNGATISEGQCVNDYCGDPPTTITSDSVCSAVSIMPGYTRNINSTMTYQCLSLLNGVMSSVDYCPVRHCQSDLYWSGVSLSCGVNECYVAAASNLYAGRRRCTTSGRTCQRWDSQSPHPHTFNSPLMFPDLTVSAAGSYCRDPGGSRGQPWCYTTSTDVEWQYCGLPLCSGLAINTGICTTPATTTTIATTTPTAETMATAASTTQVTILTTATAAATPETPTAPETPIMTMRYRKWPNDRNDMELLTLTVVARNAVDCCRQCSRQPECVMAKFGAGTTDCRLYRQNMNSSSSVTCSIVGCYLLVGVV